MRATPVDPRDSDVSGLELPSREGRKAPPHPPLQRLSRSAEEMEFLDGGGMLTLCLAPMTQSGPVYVRPLRPTAPKSRVRLRKCLESNWTNSSP
jgi:hypothetical protein